jgi:pectin methylesterase-like acyl-CoA thioesterase
MKNRLFYVAIFLLLALGVVFSACATTVENTEVAEPSAETTSSEPVNHSLLAHHE